MKKALASVAFLLASPAFGGVVFAEKDHETAKADLAVLAPLLLGKMNSKAQAAADSMYAEVYTAHVRLHEGNPDWGHVWIYGESAYGATPDKPYRQTVFQLVPQEDGTIHGFQYRLRTPAAYAATALKGTPPAIMIDDLVPLPGCTMIWQRTGMTSFSGAMRKGECRNKYRGAAYLASQSRVSPGFLYTWDQGMSADDKQVWGPTKGGYEFRP
jgi:CpeT protein